MLVLKRSVLVPVLAVRPMDVRVHDLLVRVLVYVRAVLAIGVFMFVMDLELMFVGVRNGLVPVRVSVPLRRQEQDPEEHEDRGGDHQGGQRVPQEEN